MDFETYVLCRNQSSQTDLSSYATKNYVDTKITNLVNNAPETLDTLKELADNFNGVATQSWVQEQGYSTGVEIDNVTIKTDNNKLTVAPELSVNSLKATSLTDGTTVKEMSAILANDFTVFYQLEEPTTAVANNLWVKPTGAPSYKYNNVACETTPTWYKKTTDSDLEINESGITPAGATFISFVDMDDEWISEWIDENLIEECSFENAEFGKYTENGYDYINIFQKVNGTNKEFYIYENNEWKTVYDTMTKENLLTETEIAAIDSGITTAKVNTYDNYATNKQDVLTAGTNIVISENNVISATSENTGIGTLIQVPAGLIEGVLVPYLPSNQNGLYEIYYRPNLSSSRVTYMGKLEKSDGQYTYGQVVRYSSTESFYVAYAASELILMKIKADGTEEQIGSATDTTEVCKLYYKYLGYPSFQNRDEVSDINYEPLEELL